jgi:hypothetical protein
MNLDRYEDTTLQDGVAASPKADDTELSDEALDRTSESSEFTKHGLCRKHSSRGD